MLRGPSTASRCPHPHLFPQSPSLLQCAATPGNPPGSPALPESPRAGHQRSFTPSPCRTAAGAGYPWLADAWRGGSTASAAGCLGSTERYYNGEGSARGWVVLTEGSRSPLLMLGHPLQMLASRVTSPRRSSLQRGLARGRFTAPSRLTVRSSAHSPAPSHSMGPPTLGGVPSRWMPQPPRCPVAGLSTVGWSDGWGHTRVVVGRCPPHSPPSIPPWHRGQSKAGASSETAGSELDRAAAPTAFSQ